MPNTYDPNIGLYGLNRGGAQVIDTTSGAQQQFSNLLSRQQQQRQLELKQLTDQQAQLKPGALRNQDELGDFLKYQNNWRQQSINAINEKDPYKKSMAQSQADMAYQQAQNFVARSKQAQQDEQGVYTNLSDPTKRYNYAPGAVDQFSANRQLSVDNPKFVKNIGTTLQAAPDYDYFTKTTKGINDKLISSAQQSYQWDKPVLDPTGKKLQPWTLGQNIDPNAENGLAHQISNQATADPKYLAALHARNPDIFANVKTPDDLHMAINLAATKEAQQGELYRKVGHGIEKPNQPDRFYEHYDYELAHPKPGVAVANQPTPAQTLITDMQKGVPGTGEKLLSLAPKGQYGNAKPLIGIDPNTSEHVFSFPPITEPIKKNIELNAQEKIDAKKDGRDANLLPETTIKQPSKIYRLNPNSPNYIADAAQMAKDQNINLTQLNQIESVKGGHGQIPQVANPPASSIVSYSVNGTRYNIPKEKAKDFEKHFPKAQKIQ